MTALEPRAAAAPNGSWLALTLLYQHGATVVTASCGALTAVQGTAPPPSTPQSPPTNEPPVPPIGCLPAGPPATTGRRLPIYVGIAVAAAGGIGAAVALGGKRSNSSP